MAGCSSDVTRFSFSSFLGGEAPPPETGAVGFAPASGPPAYAPPGRGPSDSFGLQESSLPPVKQAAAPPRPTWTAKAPDRPPPLWTDEPAAWRNDPPPWKDGDPFPVPESSVGRGKLAEPAAGQPLGWRGRYTMRAGDSLYAVAQRHKVSLEELKRANGITDVGKVRVGSVLAVPERTATAASTLGPAAIPPRVVQVKPQVVTAPQAKPAWTPAPASKIAAEAPRMAAASPKLAAPEKAVTQDDSTATGALPAPPAATDGRFRWPAHGKIIASFGLQPNGAKNDGITLAAPMGTGIHAAEAGRVHYVGDGLKGYGNLILIRHANGWVSAYAHADKMFVKVGDQVRRGQVIGTVGKTGPVSQPELRFELRKGTVPVDPVPHLGN
jgi:murein DD-endopeptidase MepM/ murein hydrolase activator NlpD